MSLSYTIDHAVASVEDVSVEVAAKSEMTKLGTSTDPKTGEQETKYALNSGDNSYQAFVIYRNLVQKRAVGAVRKFSITFMTWATALDSVSGLETKRPISVSTTYTVPGDMTIEIADLDDLLGNAFSFQFLSVTAKVRDTTWLATLLRGGTEVK